MPLLSVAEDAVANKSVVHRIAASLTTVNDSASLTTVDDDDEEEEEDDGSVALLCLSINI